MGGGRGPGSRFRYTGGHAVTISALSELALRLAITLCGITAAERIADRREYRLSLFAFVAASCVASMFVFSGDYTRNSGFLATGSVLISLGTLLIALAFESEQLRKVLGLGIALSLYLNVFVLVERVAEFLFTRAAEQELRPEFIVLQVIAMLAVSAWSNGVSRRIAEKSGTAANDRP